MQIEHTTYFKDKIDILNIKGALTAKTASDLETEVSVLLMKETPVIVLNCAKLEYVSSDGIGILPYLARKAKSSRGEIILAELPSETATLFKLLHFERVFNIFPDLKTALKVTAEKYVDIKNEYTDLIKKNRLKFEAEERLELEDNFFKNPLIIECERCKHFVRVHKEGDYMCPVCHLEFSVKEDGTVVF